MSRKIDVKIDSMRRQIAEMRKANEEKGLVSSPPNTVSNVDAERATGDLYPLFNFIARYTSICDRSDAIQELTEEQDEFINSFDDDLKTTFNNNEYRVVGRMLGSAVHAINSRAEYDIGGYLAILSVTLRVGKLDSVSRVFRLRGDNDE